ncbi:hypothetical protein GCM10007932_34920 [Vibrio penaeicida]|uniref:Uncharacterized protein n=3 Tax=Vibrio penaeicida TaxID=104609 RepID=A0AAV5NVX9_9VIBR|nr:hypothetical protein GCM10007932_34920 [Vibrio penaeicida]
MNKRNLAFDSREPQRQDNLGREKHRFQLKNTLGENLSFTKSQDDSPISLIRKLRSSGINDDISFWNEHRLAATDLITISYILFYTHLIARGTVIFFVPISFFISLGAFFVHPFNDALEVFVHLNTMSALYVLMPFGSTWFFLWLLFEKFPASLAHKLVRKKHELNRQTGMVSLYGNDEDVIYSHPFVEFDCRLFSSTNQYGHLSFGIALVHRYCDYSQHVTIGEMIGSTHPDDHKRLWNVIQQYMDVSQPLPDLPLLEAFRSKDPTTAAYDKEIGRDPKYWRSMSDKEFDQVVAQMAENQKHIPPLGKPINIYAQTPEEIHVV